MFAATFDGFSSITFHKLGMRVHISRRHRTAGVFRLSAGVHGASIGALTRKPEGRLDWQPIGNDRPLPAEILDVIATMI